MDRTRSATRRVTRAAKRLFAKRRSKAPPARSSRDHGYVCAFVRGRWCGGWYETYFSAVSLVSGGATACGRRVAGLPSRFEAFFLLCKLAQARSPGVVCR